MKKGSTADFLIRAVLDQAFRELAIADPSRAFEAFDLSEGEKEILRSRDCRFLGLLGNAAAPGESPAERPLEMEHADPAVPALPSLPEVKLLLRLTPHAAHPPGSEPSVSYAASLHPWPCDEEPRADGDINEQDTAGAGLPAPGVAWIIRIAPQVVEARDVGLVVAYSASIHPLVSGSEETGVSVRESAQALGNPPWNHHVESSAAKSAARAVRAAEPDERYEKLLELVDALQTGDARG